MTSEYIVEYKAEASWAGRRPAPRIHTPAIVQELGYWIADAERSGGRAVRQVLFDEFCDSVRSNSGFDYESIPVDVDSKVHRRYQSRRLSGRWEHLPVRITLEKHREYITVSTIIELAQLEDASKLNAPFAARLAAAVDNLSEALTERQKEISGVRVRLERTMTVRARLRDTYQEIFITPWEGFYGQVLSKSVAEMGSRLEGVFTDFRGFVASSVDGDGRFHLSPQHLPFFAKDVPPTRKQSVSTARFPREESVLRARSILPFMTAESQDPREADEKELTVTRFLDGRCIYASTLGAQPPESAARELPTTYFMLTCGINSWKTGRLIHRIHTLGTLCHAARRYMSGLVDAGNRLDGMEKEDLATIEKQFPEMIFGGKITEGLQKLFAASEKLRQIREFVPDLESLDKIRELQSDAENLPKTKQSLPDTLPYRVERSRYYRSQFKSLIQGLRIGPYGRIDGFQRYDEFEERRFGSAYEFVDMVGKRFDRLEQQLLARYQQLRAAEAASFLKVTTQATEKIEGFQALADAGFLLVLAPYYAGKSLSLVYIFLLKSMGRSSGLPSDPMSGLESWFTALSLVAGTVIFLARLIYRKDEKTKEQEKIKQEKSEYFTKLNLAEPRPPKESARDRLTPAA